MRARIVALGWGAFLLVGCNQLLGIEESEVATDTQLGAACETVAQCESGEQCEDGHCTTIDAGAMDGATPAEAGAIDRDAGDTGVIAASDAGDAGDADATPPEPDARQPECEPGSRRCEGAAQIQRSLCVDGFWQAEPACENGELCDGATGLCAPVVAGCSGREPGEAFCTGRERVVCGPDLVTAERETCPTIEHCRGSVDGKCLPCVAGEHSCEGNVLQVCNAERNGWDEVTTCEDAPCNADLAMCTTLVCAPSAYSCNTATNTLRLCNADGSAFLEETPCGDGICDAAHGQCDACAPSEFSCGSGTDVRVCDAEGQQLTTKSCSEYTSATTPLCSDALKACVGCIAPASSCVGTSAQQSCKDDGSWDVPAACVDQTCYQGACTGHCGPDVAPRCAPGGGSEMCGADGEWATVESAAQCPVCIGDGVCVACNDGDTRCDDSGHQSTCVNNAWDGPTSCVDKTCVGKVCSGECAPGQSKCRSDGRYTCNAQGMFTRAQACTMCQEEVTGARCVTCQLGDYSCMNADLYRCNDQQTGWSFVTSCTSAALCDEDAGKCTNQVCNPNEVTCSGSELRTCNGTGSAYASTKTCSGTFDICDADGASGAGQCDRCAESSKTCTGPSTLSTCSSDGQTVTTSTCSGSTPACYNGACKPCNPNATPNGCDGLDKTRACQSDGTWGTATACMNTTCQSATGTCGGECAQGQARCATGGTVREKCATSGFYTFDMTCPGVGGVCVGAGNCVACANGATRCQDSSHQFTCVNNGWGTAFACSNQTCFGDSGGLGGKCQGTCDPGDKRCVSGARAYDPCGGTGTPDTTQRVTCSGNPASDATWQVCRNAAGADTAACVTAPDTLIGFPDAASQGGADVPLYNYEWQFQPVTVSAQLRLFTLTAAIKSVAVSNQSIQMAIFTQRRDSVTMADQPDRRVANTALSTAVAGANTLSVVGTVTLNAGTYWIGVRISNGNTGDPDSEVGRLHAYGKSGAPYLWWQPATLNAALPDPFPSTTIRSGFQLGVSGTGKPTL